jgi:outer membrane protein TolC
MTAGAIVRPSLSRPLSLALAGALLAAGAARCADPAAAPQKLTLDECVRTALGNQPAIRAREGELGAAAAQQKVALSYMLPQAGVTTRFTQMDRHLFVVNPGLSGPSLDVFTDAAAFFSIARQAGPAAANAAIANPNGPVFSAAKQAALAVAPTNFQTDLLGERFLTTDVLVTQPLYTGGKLLYRNQQAKLGIEAASQDVTMTREQIVFAVTRAYNSVLLARELGRVAEEARGQFQATENLAQSLLKAGNEQITTADLRRAAALRALAENQKIEARRTADQALAGLRAAMGLRQVMPLEIADDRLAYAPIELDRDALLAQAVAQRPEMVKAQLAVQAAELERKVAKAAFRPDVGAFARMSTIQDNRDYPNPTQPTQFAAGVEASLTLAAGGRRIAERHKADALYEAAVAARDVVRNQVELEVVQAFLEWQEMAERLPLAKKAADSAEEALKRLRDELALGLEDKDYPRHFDNRLSTRILLSQAELAYYQEVFAYNLALAKVRLATGAP